MLVSLTSLIDFIDTVDIIHVVDSFVSLICPSYIIDIIDMFSFLDSTARWSGTGPNLQAGNLPQVILHTLRPCQVRLEE